MVFVGFAIVAFVDEGEDEVDECEHEGEGKVEFEGFVGGESDGPAEGEEDHEE